LLGLGSPRDGAAPPSGDAAAAAPAVGKAEGGDGAAEAMRPTEVRPRPCHAPSVFHTSVAQHELFRTPIVLLLFDFAAAVAPPP